MLAVSPTCSHRSPRTRATSANASCPRWLDDDGAADAPLLGTDPYGRDLLSRLIHGAQVSLIVAALTRLGNVVLLISLLLWPRFARVVRGETLSLRERDYVKLARVAGCSHLRIVVRHLLPNLVPTILVLTTFQVGYVVVLEATLSFLGSGCRRRVPPGATVDAETGITAGRRLGAEPGAARGAGCAVC